MALLRVRVARNAGGGSVTVPTECQEKIMTTHPRMSARNMVGRGRLAMGVSNVELAKLLGCSRRTMQRWLAGQTAPVPAELGRLAALVEPHDAQLADEIMANANGELEDFGFPPLPPLARPDAAVSAPLVASRHLVDALVCAASDAMDASPRALRPALHAAFRCARELGLSLEAIEEALRPPVETRGARPRA